MSWIILIFWVSVFVLALYAMVKNLTSQEAPFIYSRPHMIAWLEHNLSLEPGSRFIELGGGGAEISARLARKYPDCHFVSIDKNYLAVLIAKLRSCRLANVEIIYGDFFKTDLSSYDYLYCFLLTKQMPALEKKLLADCQPGAVVLSYIFRLPNKSAEKTITSCHEPLYFYHF